MYKAFFFFFIVTNGVYLSFVLHMMSTTSLLNFTNTKLSMSANTYALTISDVATSLLSCTYISKENMIPSRYTAGEATSSFYITALFPPVSAYSSFNFPIPLFFYHCNQVQYLALLLSGQVLSILQVKYYLVV